MGQFEALLLRVVVRLCLEALPGTCCEVASELWKKPGGGLFVVGDSRSRSSEEKAGAVPLRGPSDPSDHWRAPPTRLHSSGWRPVRPRVVRVRARRLYENSYEFDPTHKIWLATNHKPVVHGTDPAIWSRLKLIPFEVSFEGREDKELKQALQPELPGILAWAVEGCLSWQREGLDFPESVVNATAEYRRESDQVGRFTEECCVVGESLTARARPLYTAYKRWAEVAGEGVLTETAFGIRLRDRFRKKHSDIGTCYLGVGLKNEPTASDEY